MQEIGSAQHSSSQSSAELSHAQPWLRVQQLDLNSLSSVQQFCSAMDGLEPQPSLLICNAGESRMHLATHRPSAATPQANQGTS